MNDMKNSWDNRHDNDAAKPADTLRKGVEKAGEGIKQGAEKAAGKIGQTVDKTADRLQGKKDY